MTNRSSTHKTGLNLTHCLMSEIHDIVGKRAVISFRIIHYFPLVANLHKDPYVNGPVMGTPRHKFVVNPDDMKNLEMYLSL